MQTSLADWWLKLHTPSVGCTGSIPDQGTKIPYASQHTPPPPRLTPPLPRQKRIRTWILCLLDLSTGYKKPK